MKNIVIISIILLLLPSCELIEINMLKDFSKETWIKNPSERYLMRWDLQENYLYEGMLKTEVIDLLGEPDATYNDSVTNDPISEYDMGSSKLTSYALCIVYRNDIVINFYEAITNL